MSFPLSVVFNKNLDIVVTPDNSGQILHYIEDAANKRKADNLVIEDMSVIYKGSTSIWRGSLFQIVDKGIFSVVYKNDSWHLRYQIDMRKLFIYTGLMSAAFGIFATIQAGMWGIGIFAFLWLCGGNWVIACIRHGSLATELAEEINELIGGKRPSPKEQEKDESLKSWL
jgi:hypothetical protein